MNKMAVSLGAVHTHTHTHTHTYIYIYTLCLQNKRENLEYKISMLNYALLNIHARDG